jgi:hypothetical protein
MESEPRLRLTIEVEAADPLAGRIGPPGTEMAEFRGWLGLANQLDALLSGLPGPEKQDEDTPEPPE